MMRHRNARLLTAHCVGVLIIIAWCLCTAPAAASERDATSSGAPDQLLELDLADLMRLEIETSSIASKYTQKVSEAPASISIVSADEIRRFGYRTLADILRGVRGLYVTYDRNYSYLGVRGFSRPGDYNTRVLVMINGQRINDAVYEQGSIGSEMPLDVDLIERVEVIRGPGSSIYGSSALLGVINVITRNGADLAGVEAAAAYGSDAAGKARLSYGRKLDDGDLLLAGTWEESDGDDHLSYRAFDDPDTAWISTDLDGDRASRLFALGRLGDLSVQGIYGRRTKDVPTAVYEMSFNDPRAETIDEYVLVDVKYERTFADDLRLMARGNFNHYLYEGDYPYEDEGDDGAFSYVNHDETRGQRWGGELQLVKPLFERHLVTVGGEVLRNSQQDQKNWDGRPYPYVYLDDTRSSTSWALYLQDEIRLHDALTLSAGIRYDHYDSFGATSSPRCALIATPHEDLTLKLMYGKAFRAPNAYELYYGDDFYQNPNPELDPETVETWELALEQSVGKHLRYSLAAFHTKIDDLISQGEDPDAPELLRFDNLDSVSIEGFEVGIEGKWPIGIHIQASYTYADAEDKDTSREPANSPRHLAKLHLRVPLLDQRLQGGLELLYIDDRKTVYGSAADDALVTNLTLYSHGVCDGLDLSASVYNLFDTSLSDPVSLDHLQDSIRQDGRAFRVTASYRF